MDDKTVIARPKKPEARQPAKPAAPIPPKASPAGKPSAPAAPPRKKISPGFISLLTTAFLLVGFSTAFFTVYVLSPTGPVPAPGDGGFTTAELQNEIVSVANDSTVDSDVALIESVTAPQIVELSGDPVLVKQVQGKARQMLKLDQENARVAAKNLGVKGDLFRMTDMLDNASNGMSEGALGSQDDFAFFQNSAFRPQAQDPGNDDNEIKGTDDTEGTSVVRVERSSVGLARNEFARSIKKSANVSEVLSEFGLEANASKAAAVALEKLYGVKSLRDNDSIAVLGAYVDNSSVQTPMQVSIYRNAEWIATVAINDQGVYAKAEDPWHNKDIFAAQLLPEETPEDIKLRLLDAIYAVALRNGLPAAVAGETIMLLSRAHDLEQPVVAGDNIAIVYSPEARDPKTGFGRVLYVRIASRSGNIECYVFQPNAGGQFECISSAGDSNIAETGMIMPVNGTVVAKFGPQGKAGDNESQMNYGVDWAAPIGTPVVAAFEGTVKSAGSEDGMGNVIRLTHADGAETAYAYLQKFASGIATGAKVTAGQTIGFVGNPPFSREPRLHFELRRNGEPVDPIGEMQANIGKGGAIDVFVQRIIHVESANRCNARNPLSTAVGLGQFIESTWLTTLRLHRPDLLVGKSRAEVLALRTNCELARAMTSAFTRDNAAVIRSTGHPVTPGNLYLAHFLGVGGAVKVLSSAPQRSIAEVFGAAHVNANPFERGKSIGYLISWAAKKMSGAGKAIAVASADQNGADNQGRTQNTDAQSGTAGEQMVRYADNPVFAELKKNIETLLR